MFINSLTHIIILFFSIIICFLTSLIISKFKTSVIKNKKILIFIFINILMTFLMIYINNIVSTSTGIKKDNVYMSLSLIMYLIYAISSTVLIIFTFFALKKESEYNFEIKTFKEYMKYTEEIESAFENLRAFKHDIKNIFATMKLYIDSGDNEKIKNYYYTKMLVMCDDMTIQNSIIEQLNKITIPEVKSIIYYKINTAYLKKININLELFDKINYIKIPLMEFCRILGIFLDNAIEATTLTEDKKISIAITKNQDSEIAIQIQNTFDNSYKINTYSIFSKNYSTKDKTRGHGLYYARKTLNNYQNTSLEVQINENIFLVVLRIQNR